MDEPEMEDVLYYKREDGAVCRYKVSENDFAIGMKDGAIATRFRPEEGLQYWEENVINGKQWQDHDERNEGEAAE